MDRGLTAMLESSYDRLTGRPAPPWTAEQRKDLQPAARHPREYRRMTNEYARASGHSLLGLAVFDRSALSAKAIGRC
jgi:hypothetical protein